MNYFGELKDAYSAEEQALRCVQKALPKAIAPELCDGIQLHINQSFPELLITVL